MVLASGSSGNCTLVEGERARVLIDCGLSARESARRLREVGCDPVRVDAVIVSHEHADHVGGAAAFSRRFGVPVHATPATARAAGLEASRLAGLAAFEAGAAFQVGDLTVSPFSVPHDSVDNVGLVVSCGASRLGYATDLGHVPALAIERLRECDVLVTEANHDPRMLEAGPYPWSVKQRIMSRHGHLSNDQMAALVAGSASTRTRHLFLAHLSRVNNTPELALAACRRALEDAGRGGVAVRLASQGAVSAEATA